VVSNAVQVLKALVQSQLQRQVPGPLKSIHSPTEIISDLAGRFDDIRHSEARACVLWLVGQYAAAPGNTVGVEGVAPWAPDTLRKAVKAFMESVISFGFPGFPYISCSLFFPPIHFVDVSCQTSDDYIGCQAAGSVSSGSAIGSSWEICTVACSI
jgi:hypothetical protein